jgi:hypothetical protein
LSSEQLSSQLQYYETIAQSLISGHGKLVSDSTAHIAHVKRTVQQQAELFTNDLAIAGKYQTCICV